MKQNVILYRSRYFSSWSGRLPYKSDGDIVGNFEKNPEQVSESRFVGVAQIPSPHPPRQVHVPFLKRQVLLVICVPSQFSKRYWNNYNNNNNNNFIFVSKGFSISANCGHLIYNTKTKLKTIYNSNIRANKNIKRLFCC